jgi:low affinity Fe/Cu permease
VTTFLVAFSLQYAQNRDTRAIQLELDEILRAHDGARGELMKVERLPNSELIQVQDEIVRERTRAVRPRTREPAGDSRSPSPPADR